VSEEQAPSGSGGPRRRRRRRRRPDPGASGAAGTGEATGGNDPKSHEPGADAGTRNAAAGAAQPGPKGSKRSKRSRRARRARSAGANGATASSKQGSGQRRSREGGAAKVKETRREVSAGGVVYRRAEDDLEVLLAARRTRRGDLAWGLAKGGIEAEESIEDAALREVREETGIVAEIEDPLGETRYFYVWDEVRIRKVVHFFLMRAVGGDTDDHDDEMEEVRWFSLDRALKRAAYRGEREVLARAAELLR
jgi:8-oxo-dGTP pyrophosphatase MutT (NUDIX family)